MKLIQLLFVVCMAVSTRHAYANEKIALRDFIRAPAYGSAKISPGGDYLGMIAERDQHIVLLILDANTLKTIRVHQAPANFSVGDFYWVGPKRLMLSTRLHMQRKASAMRSGQWVAVNVDGSSLLDLNNIGGASDDFTGAKPIKSANVIHGPLQLIDAVPEDEAHIVVSTFEHEKEGARTILVNLDTFTGHYELLAYAPANNCKFTLKKSHRPSYALCSEQLKKDDNKSFRTQHYQFFENDKWLPVGNSFTTKSTTRLLAENDDGKISATNNDGLSPISFGFINTSSGQYEAVYQDKAVDVAGTIFASDGVTVLGVVTEAAAPQITMLNTQHADSELYARIVSSFPKQYVEFINATLDGNKILLSIRSDTNSGELFLYERDTQQARFLLRQRDWLKASEMAEVKSLKIQSRDGIDLYAYLTLPHDNVGKKPFPLIVNPHGGPIGRRNNWGFNRDAQMLASRGYAVLQVNFRGSSGYGIEFEKLGNMEWGGKIQDDIIDATRWVTEQGYADTDRICIFGASFGGYSALMAPIREPGMFKCAVGYVGIYDMELMDSVGIAAMPRRDPQFIVNNLGKDKVKLKSISPTENAEKIRIPVFLAAGGIDQRAPLIHTERMQAALKKAGNPAEEVIIHADEEHGFYDEKNELDLYTKMLVFFEKYIGKK
ncbi:MAG: alpha/beta hydrolase family protein [Arenimonas sp.]